MRIDTKSVMRHALDQVAATLGLLALLASGWASGVVCTAAHPNDSMPQSTPSATFADHGDGTVTHNLTGLMWKRCVEGLSGTGCTTGTAATLSWSAALATAVADSTAGYHDWRLPNRNELESLIEHCGWGPSINQTIFPATPAAQTFYTSTTYQPSPTRAVGISFLDGFPYVLDKTFPFSVRLVRAGRTFDAFDAQPSLLTVTKGGTGSGTVTSVPPGINCGADCSEVYAANSLVTLTATPAAGSAFMGWLGACIGTGPCNVRILNATSVSATFAPNTVVPKADFDANSAYDALTDGLLLIRYLRGVTGSSLTNGALGNMATRTVPGDIKNFMDNIGPLLDVDGNGQVDLHFDGLLLARYLFGFRGSVLTAGAIGDGATRTPQQIEQHIQSLLP